MKQFKTLGLCLLMLTVLASCWKGDPTLTVSAPNSLYFVQTTVPVFEQCDLQDRTALERANQAVVLPTVDCADGQCVVSGAGYNSKDHPFHIAFLDEASECKLRDLDGLEFTESYSVEVFMNQAYLRSLGLSKSEVQNLGHRNFAGSRYGDLRSTWIDELNDDVEVTIFYDELPTQDEFVVSGRTVTFVLAEISTVSEN